MSSTIDRVNKEMPGHTDTLSMAMNQMSDTNKHALHNQMTINAVIMTLEPFRSLWAPRFETQFPFLPSPYFRPRCKLRIGPWSEWEVEWGLTEVTCVVIVL